MKFVITLIASVSAMSMGISPSCVADDGAAQVAGSKCHIEGNPETICACPRLGYTGPMDCAVVTGGFGSSVCMFKGTTDPCPCP